MYIEATNIVFLESSAIKEEGGEEFIPSLDNSYSGANFFDRDTQIMHLVRVTCLSHDMPVQVLSLGNF